MGANSARCCCADDVSGSQKDVLDPNTVGSLSSLADGEESVPKSATLLPPMQATQEVEPVEPVAFAPPPAEIETPSPQPAKAGSEFKVILKKTADCSSLGMAVDIAEQTTLIVETVIGGMVDNWNKEHVDSPELQVVKGDVILSVNGVFGDAMKMTQACKKDPVLELKVQRIPVAQE
mmetsp:Transcript_25759/g.40727  ORF Transcript_25759/g.40727 Transcript_25759/m.40727 type:complete len:177 (-) Transcript_25759:73-603(-)